MQKMAQTFDSMKQEIEIVFQDQTLEVRKNPKPRLDGITILTKDTITNSFISFMERRFNLVLHNVSLDENEFKETKVRFFFRFRDEVPPKW